MGAIASSVFPAMAFAASLYRIHGLSLLLQASR